MIQGAGILILTENNKGLFLLRSGDSPQPLQWCLPGGKLEEEDDNLEACAIRETAEECGYTATEDRLFPLTRTANEDIDFSTFLCRVKAPFAAEVDAAEIIGYCWAPIDHPPEPLLAGCRVACRRLSMVEIDVAKAMAAGELVSPQVYETITLFNMRITGTGKSYRHKIEEHVWRDPELYLNPAFLERCNGLPVIMEHPKKSVLDSKEFNNRMVGTIIYPYIKGEDVWGIARIMDDMAIKLLESEQLSTSPAVTFDYRSENIQGETPNGEKILIEGKPSLLDHLAICYEGVWDKSGPPTGIDRQGAELAMADSVNEYSGLADFINKLRMLDVKISNHLSRR